MFEPFLSDSHRFALITGIAACLAGAACSRADSDADAYSMIAEVVAAPSKLDRLGAAGRDKVHRMLTWDAKAQQILAIYDAVVDGRTDFSTLGFCAGQAERRSGTISIN